jgi:hypothetical protein
MDEKSRTTNLPADRAFVVQFTASAGSTPFRGRVEHLASGWVTHFDSLTCLGDFVEQVLGPGPIEDQATGPSDPVAANQPADLARGNR